MCIYIFGQQNNIIRDLIYRFFYGHGDTKNTFKNSFSASLVNIFVSLAMVKFLGVYGIVLGTVIAGAFSLVSILIRFKRNYEFKFDKKIVCPELFKNEIALLVAIVCTCVFKRIVAINSYLVGFFAFGIVSVLVFAIVLFITRSTLIDYVKK